MSHVVCECRKKRNIYDANPGFIDHVRNVHGVDVNAGNSHWAHCNDCKKRRRIPSLEHLVEHLNTIHNFNAKIVCEEAISDIYS